MRKKGKGQALIVALIAAAAAIVLYSLIFKLFRWQHYLIAAAVALLVGRVAFIMAQGLDTTREAPAQQPIPKTGDSAVDSLVEKGQEMLAQIRRENDLIPDARLSERMAQLDDVADRIFRTVAEKPQKAPQIRRFMDYYLPTTLKMLAGYRKMDERQLSGGEAEKTRAQIQEAMDMVVGAFEKQLNTLYQDDMMDISTDIDVLETLLRQDGLVEVENPSEYMLSGKPEGASGSVVACSMEGTRPILLEVQALVCHSNFGIPRRTAAGTDFNRVNLLMAVLEKRLGLKLGDCDAYVNIAGGIKMNEPAIDLGIVLALISSYKDKPIDEKTICFGEVGLSGEVRAVNMAEQRVQEAKKLGFEVCILPEVCRKSMTEVKGIRLVGVSNLLDAMNYLK